MHTPSLTAVLHEDFTDAPSGLTGYVLADLLGKNYYTLISGLSRQKGHKFGADLVLPLMQKSRSARGMHFLAREMGGAFIRLPKARRSLGSSQQQCMKAIKAFGDLMQEVSVALMDGKIKPEERMRIHKDAYEAVVAILTLARQIEEECEEGDEL